MLEKQIEELREKLNRSIEEEEVSKTAQFFVQFFYGDFTKMSCKKARFIVKL